MVQGTTTETRSHRRQHAELAKFHAELFKGASDHRVHAFDLEARRWVVTYPKRLGVRDSHFDVHVPGRDVLEIERWMGKIEDAAARSIRVVTNGKRPSHQDIVNLAQYAALLRSRAPALESGMVELENLESSRTGWPEIDGMFYRRDDAGRAVGLQRSLRLSLLLRTFRRWLKTFQEHKRYIITHDPIGGLVIADNPMLSLAGDSGDFETVALPLSPHWLLEFYWYGGASGRCEITDAKRWLCNSVSLKMAFRHVYSPKPSLDYTRDGHTSSVLLDGDDPKALVTFLWLGEGRPVRR